MTQNSPTTGRTVSTGTTSATAATAARPTNAFVGASWAALLAGVVAFVVGLWNAEMLLSEKGYYLTVLMFGLFAAVSLQKSVRDQLEGITVSPIYFGLAWLSVGAALLLLAVGLWNAVLLPSEKGFYAMAFALSLFAAVAVQKNIRDLAAADAPAADVVKESHPGTGTWSSPTDPR
jgi:uncharacterized membrane protein YiaA